MTQKTGLIISYTLITIVSLYFCSGVFFGEFRYDEIYFMHSSWSIENHTSRPIDVYLPGGYPFLLSKGLSFFDNNLSYFLFVRWMNIFIFIFISIFLIISINKVIKPKYFFEKILICLFSSISLIYLSSIRGFEVRPESLANFFLVLSFSFLLFSGEQRRVNTGIFYLSQFSCLTASFLSARYAGPLSIIFLLNFFLYIKFSQRRRLDISIFIVLFSLYFLFLFNFIHSPAEIINSLELVEDINSNRAERSVENKLSVFGLGAYANKLPSYPFLEHYRPFTFLFFVALTVFSFIECKKNSDKLIVISSFFSFTSCMLFLIFMDAYPWDYAATHEFLLLLMLSILLLKVISNNKALFAFKSTLFILVAYLLYPSLFVINLNQPVLSDIISSQTDTQHDAIENMNYKEALALRMKVHINSSANYQIDLMKRICNDYSTDSNYIFNLNYSFHPVCIKDEYSNLYQSRGHSQEDIIKKIEEKGVITHKDSRYLLYSIIKNK